MARGLSEVDSSACKKAIVVEEQRWGFWKCHDRLRALGYTWNHKRTWHVYCQLPLNLPRRTKRGVPQRERQSLFVEPRMNAVWAVDSCATRSTAVACFER